ncbi:hypothetical protein [Clostridium vitabionis]|uniref:hypothetical protein n=1 Tax=Clostridium vitabionis TaxID=2784388 RepID=UPI00188BB668|nr:hypothetical protein [Clostridium vitabionis]
MAEKNVVVKKDSDLVPGETLHAKVLHITAETEGVDFNGLLARLTQYVNIGDALAHVERQMKYVVQIPLKDQEAFNAGELFLNQNTKTGVLWPTLYKTAENGKRQFVDNLPIKEEALVKGNPFDAIAMGYHNIYMQEQMNELSEMINRTYKAVERIERGQMDDRIGELKAGRDQILLALKLDPERRSMEIAEGRSHILSAQKKLLQTFKSRVEGFTPIPKDERDRFWLEFRHGGILQEKDKEFSDIQEYYGFYLEATQLLAASYAIYGDMDEAEKVFEIAKTEMSEIRFDSIKTIDYIHKQTQELFYNCPEEYIEAEKDVCMADAKDYDVIDVEVTGQKLLEVFGNVRKEEIPESDTEQ